MTVRCATCGTRTDSVILVTVRGHDQFKCLHCVEKDKPNVNEDQSKRNI